MKQFPHYNYIYICQSDWGDVHLDEIIKTLEDSIHELNEKIQEKRLHARKLEIKNAGDEKNPVFWRGLNSDIILIANKDRYLPEYIYQFSHEYCHYLISNEGNISDRFGWLEETICEVSSFYVLAKISQKWKINFPYSNWDSEWKKIDQYLACLLDKIKEKDNFNNWLAEKLDSLYMNKEDRESNKVIAKKILPLFLERPHLWNALLDFKDIKFNGQTSLEEFMQSWESISQNLYKSDVIELKKTLLNQDFFF